MKTTQTINIVQNLLQQKIFKLHETLIVMKHWTSWNTDRHETLIIMNHWLSWNNDRHEYIANICYTSDLSHNSIHVHGIVTLHIIISDISSQSVQSSITKSVYTNSCKTTISENHKHHNIGSHLKTKVNMSNALATL